MRRLVPLNYLVEVRAQRRQVYVEHYGLTVENSYRSLAEYTMHVKLDLLKLGSFLSLVCDESVCKTERTTSICKGIDWT